VERGLRDGELLGVVTTNALELGVDVGQLDVSILAGYPGSIAATWQQMGRAGRRRGTSVSVLIAGGGPVDRYVVDHPEFLLDSRRKRPAWTRTTCTSCSATSRRPASSCRSSPAKVRPSEAEPLLAFLGEEGMVRHAADDRWYWSNENFPASSVSLRAAAEENVVIIDTTPDRPRVIGEIDIFAAQTLVHEDAIYMHESAQFHVDKLDWDERKAYVRRVDVDHYTYADRAVTLKPLETFAVAPAAGGDRAHGEVMVSSLVSMFKKLKFGTDENLGWGPVHLPEIELQTTAYWLMLGSAAEGWSRAELDVALLGMGRAIQAVAAVLLMVDPRDLGLVSQVRSPHNGSPTVYLYEAVPGGVGLSERLFERHDELIAGAADLIAGCGCESGCPACTGPRLEPDVDAKASGAGCSMP
jgi:DEAD/DEAH box helicase domain-containing protein